MKISKKQILPRFVKVSFFFCVKCFIFKIFYWYIISIDGTFSSSQASLHQVHITPNPNPNISLAYQSWNTVVGLYCFRGIVKWVIPDTYPFVIPVCNYYLEMVNKILSISVLAPCFEPRSNSTGAGDWGFDSLSNIYHVVQTSVRHVGLMVNALLIKRSEFRLWLESLCLGLGQDTFTVPLHPGVLICTGKLNDGVALRWTCMPVKGGGEGVKNTTDRFRKPLAQETADKHQSNGPLGLKTYADIRDGRSQYQLPR